jgi:hypothetical protein
MKTLAIAVVLAGGALLAHRQLPSLVASQLRDELAARGYPDARFRVVAVELDRIELADVELAPGLELGTVELDAGISLLWREPDVISIRGAHVRAELLTRASTGGGAELPAREVRIANSTVELGATRFAIAGRVQRDGDAELTATAAHWTVGGETLDDLRLTVDADRACAVATHGTTAVSACTPLATWTRLAVPVTWSLHDPAWAVTGTATLSLGDHVVVQEGAFEARVPRWSRAGVAIEDASITGELAGPIESLAGTAHVEVRGGRIDGIAFTDLETDLELGLVDRVLRALPADVHVRDATAPGPAGVVRAHAATVTLPYVLTVRDGQITTTRVAARPIEIAAERVEVAGSALADVIATVTDASIAWRARTLTSGPVTAFAPSGVATKTGVRWQAVRAQLGETTLVHPAGTISPDRTIAWHADAARWREVSIDAPAGTLRGGQLEVHASTGRWRELQLTRLRGVLADGELVLHADGGHWRDVALVALDGRWASGQLTWRLQEAVRAGDVVHDLEGTSTEDAHAIAWSAVRLGRFELGSGTLGLAAIDDRWQLAHATVAAYGGRAALVRSAPIDGALDFDLRGLRLDKLVAVLGPRARAEGELAGRLVVRGGELSRVELASTGGGFRFGDRAWVDRAVADLAAGQVAVPQRIGGALADFTYRRLALVLALAPAPSGPTLHVELRGAGRRVAQELELDITIRGLREAMGLLARAREST